MRIGKWRKSQKSNGYWNKTSSGRVVFLHIEHSEYGDQNTWVVLRKNGVGDSVNYPLTREWSLSKAKDYMLNYMKNNPYGW